MVLDLLKKIVYLLDIFFFYLYHRGRNLTIKRKINVKFVDPFKNTFYEAVMLLLATIRVVTSVVLVEGAV